MLTFCSRLCRALVLRGRRTCLSPTLVEKLLLPGSAVRSKKSVAGVRHYPTHTARFPTSISLMSIGLGSRLLWRHTIGTGPWSIAFNGRDLSAGVFWVALFCLALRGGLFAVL